VLYTLQIPAGINFSYFGTLAMSSDLRQIAIAGSSDRTNAGFIVVWDLQKPEHPQILKGHVGRIRTLEFSPDASRLVSSSLSQTTNQTKLWDVGTGEELLSDNTGQFIMKFSDKGRELLGIRAKDDGEISITRWDSSPPLSMVEAQHLVASILNRVQSELPTTSELVANIQADTSLPSELRAAAVTALWQWPRQTELLQAAWSRLSLTQPTSQDLERALAYLADVRASDPVNKSASLASAVANHRLNRSSDAQAALNQFRQSLVQSPEPRMAEHEQIQAFLSEFSFQPSGRQDQATGELRDQGKLDAALKEYQAAIEVNTKSFWIDPYYERAEILFEQNKLEEAHSEFRKVIEIDPSNYLAHNELGRILLVQEKLDEAADQFRLTIDLKPDYAWAHRNLGITKKKQGKLPEALAAHRIAIQLEPDLASHHNGLAWLLVTGRDANGGFLNVEEGLREAQRSCELAPNNGNSQNTLGVAYYRNKQWQLAIDALKKSIELGNDDIFNWLFLAMAEARLNRQDQARAWYDKALTWSESNQLDTEQNSFLEEASVFFETDSSELGTADKEQADPEF